MAPRITEQSAQKSLVSLSARDTERASEFRHLPRAFDDGDDDTESPTPVYAAFYNEGGAEGIRAMTNLPPAFQHVVGNIGQH